MLLSLILKISKQIWINNIYSIIVNHKDPSLSSFDLILSQDHRFHSFSYFPLLSRSRLSLGFFTHPIQPQINIYLTYFVFFTVLLLNFCRFNTNSSFFHISANKFELFTLFDNLQKFPFIFTTFKSFILPMERIMEIYLYLTIFYGRKSITDKI